jgi:hypothetical protein
MIVAKSGYSDAYARVRRSGKMAVQAELIWGFLVPRTFATDRVLVAVTLEPSSSGRGQGGCRGWGWWWNGARVSWGGGGAGPARAGT